MTFFNKFRENLKTIDIFGQQITLCFRQEENYKTSLGAVMSICIIGTIVSFFYANIIDFFAMNQVNSQQETQFSDDAGPIILSPEDFMFAVQIDQTNFTTNPYFNITLEQRLYTRDENGTQIKQPSQFIDMIPCTYDHFKPVFEKYNATFENEFKQYALYNFLCPDLSHPLSKNFTVGGAWTSNIYIQGSKYYFLKFSVVSCQNNTNQNRAWNPVCQTPNLNGTYRFQVFTTNFLINPNLPHQYVKPYIAIDQYYSFAPNQLFVQSDIYFRPKTITTDEGILMYPKKETLTYVSRDYRDSREQYSVGGLSKSYFGAFYFVRSPFSYNIERSYLRLDGLLSYLGGFTQFMIVVVGLLVKLYNREHMIVEMANELYQFDFNRMKKQTTTQKLNNLLIQTAKGREQLRKNIHKNKGETGIDSKSPNKNSQDCQLKIQNKDQPDMVILKDSCQASPKMSTIIKQSIQKTKSNLYKQFKQLVDDQQYIGISLRLLISQILPFSFIQNERCLFIQKAIDEVNQELDIKNIIKQLHEMTKLKKVLFDPDQLVLFNFTQRPKITFQKERINRLSTLFYQKEQPPQDDILFKTFQELAIAYSKILGQDEDSQNEQQIQFNKRLISLLGAHLPYMLEQRIAEQQDLEFVDYQSKENKSDNEEINSENQENLENPGRVKNYLTGKKK